MYVYACIARALVIISKRLISNGDSQLWHWCLVSHSSSYTFNTSKAVAATTMAKRKSRQTIQLNPNLRTKGVCQYVCPGVTITKIVMQHATDS